MEKKVQFPGPTAEAQTPKHCSTATIKWEYEDDLQHEITTGMRRASILDGARLYPYVFVGAEKVYLEKL